MPVRFWGDDGGERYRAAYFDVYPGVWRQGDWVRFREQGTCVITGRSDATLNRGGVRMGTSELYAVVEELPGGRRTAWSCTSRTTRAAPGELILFVVADLDDDLRARIAGALRAQLSPRHVPDTIAAVPAIPRTLTGKKLEAPVKRILRGADADAVASRGALAEPERDRCVCGVRAGKVGHEEERRDDGRPARVGAAADRQRRTRRTAAASCARRWRSSPTRPASACCCAAGRARRPDRVFLAERGGGRRVGRADVGRGGRARPNAVAQALLDRGLGAERPLMILSGNAIDHALLTLGGFLAGVPVVPVSPAYSLMSQDYGKVKHIAALVKPGLVYAADAGPFGGVLARRRLRRRRARALRAARARRASPSWSRPGRRWTSRTRWRAVGPDSVAKILFTSRLDGDAQGRASTRTGCCAPTSRALAQIWPFTEDTPPVLVDWLPWNHTFGGNHNFNLILKRGGTLYIDAGRPAPPLIPITVRNLTEIAPTIYFNVPAGYGALLPFLERDEALRARFFERLDLIFYAAAALPQDLWTRLEDVAREARGEPVMMTSSWGLTETSPLATAAHFPIDRAGVIGVPVPGVRDQARAGRRQARDAREGPERHAGLLRPAGR